MKIKIFTVLLTAVLLMTGCTATFDANPNVPTAQMPNDASQSISAAAQEPFTPDVPAPQPAEPLTREQARDLALEHAGLTADQVTRIEVEYEIDDRIPRYEIQFRYDGWEYDYEIHAETGKILSYDRDRD